MLMKKSPSMALSPRGFSVLLDCRWTGGDSDKTEMFYVRIKLVDSIGMSSYKYMYLRKASKSTCVHAA